MDWILNKILFTSFILTSLFISSSMAQVTKRDQAKQLYESLVKLPPTKLELDFVETYIENNDYETVASIIIDPHSPSAPANHPINSMGAFYSVNLQNMVSRWTNTESSAQVPLNDMTASILGQVKENRSFKKLFYEDIYYLVSGVVGSQYFAFQLPNYPSNSILPSNIPTSARPQAACAEVISNTQNANSKVFVYYQNPTNPNNPADKGCRVSNNYTMSRINTCKGVDCLYVPNQDFLLDAGIKVQTSNSHFSEFEQGYFDLSESNILQRTSQMGTSTEREGAIAGIFSMRAWGASYYSAGTNRRAVAFAMKNFMCKEMEELNDTTIPDFRVRRDVDRAPGDQPLIFQTKCVGCHAGMDALGGAFAYYNFPAGAIDYEEGVVVEKMYHNPVYANGYVTNDDSFINLWTQGKNADLGWRGPASGNGARMFGQAITQSDAFDTCMTKQVADSVCSKVKYTVSEDQYSDIIAKYASEFRSHENLKKLFIDLATECTKAYQ
ncbi:hypothetical protein N9N67_02165 [Bacteriovoracaceae bacterium]|nr:hypothetical protein [Bacteriovoracaceae bacterium]